MNPVLINMLQEFKNSIEQIFNCNFKSNFELNPIVFNSPSNASNFSLTIYEGGGGYVMNTLIPNDRVILKINYFQVNPAGKGMGTKVFTKLKTNVKKAGIIKRLVAIPENEVAQAFWKKLGFKPWNGNNSWLYLDI